MGLGFPLLVNLAGNNCTVFGGNERALRRVRELLRFDAKVTVIAPQVCSALAEMSATGQIRHIPRKYFRGDCSNSQVCVAATDDDATNIAISTECKNKSIPVNVISPADYGTFTFPRLVITDGLVLSLTGTLSAEALTKLQIQLQNELPLWLDSLHAEDNM